MPCPRGLPTATSLLSHPHLTAQVLLDGVPLEKYDVHNLRRQISVVAQVLLSPTHPSSIPSGASAAPMQCSPSSPLTHTPPLPLHSARVAGQRPLLDDDPREHHVRAAARGARGDHRRADRGRVPQGQRVGVHPDLPAPPHGQSGRVWAVPRLLLAPRMPLGGLSARGRPQLATTGSSDCM